jgi:hypothetical protein
MCGARMRTPQVEFSPKLSWTSYHQPGRNVINATTWAFPRTHPICDREKNISNRSAAALYLSAAAAAAATTSTTPSATPPQNKILCPLREAQLVVRVAQDTMIALQRWMCLLPCYC